MTKLFTRNEKQSRTNEIVACLSFLSKSLFRCLSFWMIRPFAVTITKNGNPNTAAVTNLKIISKVAPLSIELEVIVWIQLSPCLVIFTEIRDADPHAARNTSTVDAVTTPFFDFCLYSIGFHTAYNLSRVKHNMVNFAEIFSYTSY